MAYKSKACLGRLATLSLVFLSLGFLYSMVSVDWLCMSVSLIAIVVVLYITTKFDI